MTELPIEAVLPDLLAALAARSAAVLEAPPGAGKTTRVPLALLGQPWLGLGKILVLEPRRLAARAAARRMAAMLGEAVGATVGYRTRLDSKIGHATRIEVVTEGILTRQIQDDPSLDGIGAVLFDEFHERSLQADLGLALCLDVQRQLRPDLRLLVMSATLDGSAVARLLGDAPVIVSHGRTFPVELRWLDKSPPRRFEDGMEALIGRAVAEEPQGDLLAFLPGQAEIRRLQTRLAARLPGIIVAPLYGDLDAEAQDAALQTRPGQRKVILATSIAETSLTIEGVRIVVDGGLMRQPRFDANGGMSRLVTLPVSKASAAQRAGRAGRTGPGLCYRLWTEAAHRALPAFHAPEIMTADLAPLALDLARWGVVDPGTLAWLDAPPPAAYAQATALLQSLGALDAAGRLTSHGRSLATLPVHPRLAHMLVRGRDLGLGDLACRLAALLSERDVLRGVTDPDLRLRLEALHGSPPAAADRATVQRVRQQTAHFRRLLGLTEQTMSSTDCGLLLGFAYPDRIALRRDAAGTHYRLSNGRGAVLPEPGPLSSSEGLAIADLDGERRESRIFLAAPLALADIEQHFAERIRETEQIVWDDREQAVMARRRRLLGDLVLAESRLSQPTETVVIDAMIAGIRSMGLACLPWTAAARSLQARLCFLRRLDGGAWPDVSDAHLLETLEAWLSPWLPGLSRRAHLERLDLTAILSASLAWEQRQTLDALAPTHVTVPSGSRLPIDYAAGELPVLAVRLQEMFGVADTPTVAGGRVKVLLHLLSPARRPVQVTQDLASFWSGAYRQVKADLKGQYPKHAWPDDPLAAPPTARAKPRR